MCKMNVKIRDGYLYKVILHTYNNNQHPKSSGRISVKGITIQCQPECRIQNLITTFKL